MITVIKNEIPVIEEKTQNVRTNDSLTEKIISCAYAVHSELGPGFQEKIYQKALCCAFETNAINYCIEKDYPVVYQDKRIGSLRIDLLVEGQVIVEVKAITGNLPKVFEAQVLSYLKISNNKVGLLINFGNKSCQVRRLIRKSL